MVALLSGAQKGCTLEEMTRELKCSVQTARRDLTRLRAAGFPVERHRAGKQILWSMKGEFPKLPPIALGPLEAAALVTAEKSLRAAGDAYFSDLVRDMLDKLRHGRNAEVARVLKRLQDSFEGVGGAKAIAPKLTPLWPEEIARAIRERRVLEITVAGGAGEKKDRQRLAPMRLSVANEKTTLQAFCYQGECLRNFALEDLHEIKLTDQIFLAHVPGPATVAGKAAEIVVPKPELIELEAEAFLESNFLDRPLHDSQVLFPGMPVFRVTMVTAIDKQLVAELMRFGASVRVIRPVRLERLILAAHRSAITIHEQRIAREREAPEPLLPLIFEN